MRAAARLAPPVPLQRREIRVLALLAIVAFAQGWTGTVITHTLAFTRETFGLDDHQISDVLALTRAFALLALAFSWWGDHRGRRLPLLVAFFLLPAANLATSFAGTVGSFAFAQSVARIGTIAIGALAVVVLAEEVRPMVRSYAVGLYVLVGSMGTGFGLLASSFAEASPEAWRWLFAVSSIPILALPLLIRHLDESAAFDADGVRPPLAAALGRGYGRRFWPLAGISFALAAFSGPAANFVLIRLENDLEWSALSAVLLLTLASSPGVVLGLLGGGRIADTVGRRPTEFAALFVGVSGGVLFYFSETGVILGIAIFVSTLGASAFGPAFASHRAELFPTSIRATAGAWVTNAAIFGGLAGFAGGRFLIEATSVPTTIAVLGGAVLASSTLIALLPETKGMHLDDVDVPLPQLPAV